jgi:molybdate transport system regulatory protein
MFEGEMIPECGRPFQIYPRSIRATETRIFPLTQIVLIKELTDKSEEADKDADRFLFNLTEDKIFCAPSMVKLLESIDETGNVRKTCASIGISYSHGWKLLHKLEEWAGYPLTRGHPGGAGGGLTNLTEEGKAFLKKHKAFMLECHNAVMKVYEKYWGN